MNRRKNKKLITLVDKDIAYIGYRFIFKKNAECDLCKHFSVCSKLEEGRVYEVINIIRTKNKLYCRITNEGVQPVEVKLSSITTSIREEIPLDTDIIVHWHEPECEFDDCKYRKLCFPIGLKDGDKIKIKEKMGKIKCPQGINLLMISADLV